MVIPHLIGYARVSTSKGNLDNQTQRLTGHGCKKVFSEKYTGTTSARKSLQRALEYVREGDALVVTKLDRLARSASDLGKISEELQKKNVDLVVLDQEIDTTSPTGKLMFTMIGAFAEFERDLIHERCKEGIAKAKERGVTFGAPRKLSDKKLKSLKSEFRAGELGKTDLAKKYGISRATLYRLCSDGPSLS